VAEPCTTWDFFRSSELCSDPNTLLRRFPFLMPFAGCALLTAVSGMVTVFALQPEADVLAMWPDDEEEQVALTSEGGEAQEPDMEGLQDNDGVPFSNPSNMLHVPSEKVPHCTCARTAALCLLHIYISLC
jgi:hypothetical protein